MRKLRKNHSGHENNVEAYACSCGCSCNCGCFCFLGINSATNRDGSYSAETSKQTSGALNRALSM
jgi:putative bacteriocin precursor